MDILRVVERSVGGRPIELVNLNQTGFAIKTRDSLEITPGDKRPVTQQLGGRYRGSRVFGETSENGTLKASWLVKGTSVDNCLSNAEIILDQVHQARYPRLLEWRPDGATYSSFYRIAGPGSFVAKHRPAQITQVLSMEFDFTWPIEPLVEWDRMDIMDDYSVNSLTDYSFDQTS